MTAASFSAPGGDENPVSPGEGRYLCGLFHLTLVEDRPIKTGELADYLGVAGATVTETFKTFDEEGLATYEPYAGTRLTERGERLAREMQWRRCLVQDFFEESAGVSLSDEEAYRVGMAIPEGKLAPLGDAVSQPCQGSCEANDPEECHGLHV